MLKTMIIVADTRVLNNILRFIEKVYALLFSREFIQNNGWLKPEK